jgi:glycosyltransferase involved in cell wall biosynthesis
MMGPTPDFTIVIPTYRRPRQLGELLRALRELEYPTTRFEIVVVDDGGGLPADFPAPFQDLNLRILSQPNAGPAAARNFGASVAEGQFLAFTDDDCRPSEHWLRALAAHFTNHPECGAGGRTINVLTRNIFSSASQLLLDYVYLYYNKDAYSATFFASNNFAVPTNPFRELGGFDTSFRRAAGEDREFCDRWVWSGRALHCVPDALVHHAHPLSLIRYLRQHFNYGVGAHAYHRARAARGAGSFRPDPQFYSRLLGFPLRREGVGRGSVLALLFLLSQVATVAGYCRRPRWNGG